MWTCGLPTTTLGGHRIRILSRAAFLMYFLAILWLEEEALAIPNFSIWLKGNLIGAAYSSSS